MASGVPPTHQVGLKTLQIRLENIKDDPEYIKAKSDDKRFIDNTNVLRLLDTVPPPQHLITGNPWMSEPTTCAAEQG